MHIVGAGPAGLFLRRCGSGAGAKAGGMGARQGCTGAGEGFERHQRESCGESGFELLFWRGRRGHLFLDGKLYTRAKKRGDVRRILELLVGFGAVPEILVEAHPHIGTNKLPKIIAAMRSGIFGGAWGVGAFWALVVDVVLEGGRGFWMCLQGWMLWRLMVMAAGAVVRNIPAKHVILATGHSARDIFELLVRREITLEAKPLAIGVRVEHPQTLIDSIQYSCESRGEYLPAAPYSVVHQVEGVGVSLHVSGRGGCALCNQAR